MTKVTVLMGGWSAEREVSLATGRDVVTALRSVGYTVTPVDVTRDLGALLRQLEPRPDVVFNALHGRYGEDGCIQGFLEILNIPYTHSGVRASAMAMDKGAAKQVFRAADIPCPEGAVVHRDRAHDVMAAPYVVKPVREGSSVGVIIVREGDNAAPLDAQSWVFGDEVLVERFIPGREISVAVMDDRALGAIEIRPHEGFYDYESKYVEGHANHFMPAPIAPERYAESLDLALRAHRALGCRGVSRCDFRYDDTEGEPGALFLLEINTQPGMVPLSLVPEIAAHAGINFPALVQWMVEHAQCDT